MIDIDAGTTSRHSTCRYETSLNCIKAMSLFEGLTRFPMDKTEYSMAYLLPLFYQVYSRYSSVHPCIVLPVMWRYPAHSYLHDCADGIRARYRDLPPAEPLLGPREKHAQAVRRRRVVWHIRCNASLRATKRIELVSAAYAEGTTADPR